MKATYASHETIKQQTAPGNPSFNLITELSVCASAWGKMCVCLVVRETCTVKEANKPKKKNQKPVFVCVGVKVICNISSHSKLDWQDKQQWKTLQRGATKQGGTEGVEQWRGSLAIKAVKSCLHQSAALSGYSVSDWKKRGLCLSAFTEQKNT